MSGTHSRGRTNQDEYRIYSGENAGAYFPDRVEERKLTPLWGALVFTSMTTKCLIRASLNLFLTRLLIIYKGERMRLTTVCIIAITYLILNLGTVSAEEISSEFSKTYKAYNNAYARGNYPRAAELAQKALDMAKKELGPEHEKTAIMEINLAHVLIINRKIEEAEPILNSARKKVEKLHGANHLSLVTIHEDLAKIHASKKELDKARQALSKAISIISKARGANDPEIANFLIQQGSIDVATNKIDVAKQDYEKALAILEEKYGKNSISTASTISLLGDIELLKKDFAKAEEYYKRTLKIYEENLVEDDPIVLAAHARMAKIFIAIRDDRFAGHADRVIKFYTDKEGEALPLFIMQPQYPVFKNGKKPQGWVLIQFDVSTSGKVEKAKIIESRPAKLFDKVTLDSAVKWRFKPKVKDGKRVKQKNTRARLVFAKDNIEVHMGEMKL
jgi:TonB family protein